MFCTALPLSFRPIYFGEGPGRSFQLVATVRNHERRYQFIVIIWTFYSEFSLNIASVSRILSIIEQYPIFQVIKI